MINKQRLLFFIILILAAVLRIYQLGSVPPGPTADEVTIGYNAFSILKTGVDEYGEKFPILLRAYDDWRPALYVYFVVPFVFLFDLSSFSVRFPSFLLSVFSIFTIFYIVNELQRVGKRENVNKSISLLCMFLLAVSPWHIYFSRIGHEWNGSLAFFVFGFYFLLRYVNSTSGRLLWIVLAACSLGLSFDFYQSAKIFIPLFVAVFSLIFWGQLWNNKKNTILGAIVGLIVILPILVTSFSPNAMIRYKGTSIFSGSDLQIAKSSERVTRNGLDARIFDNRRVLIGMLPVHAYLSHFDLLWLSANAGNEEFKTPDFGLLHLFEVLLVVLGIYVVIRSNLDKRIKLLFLLWFIIFPIPASLSSGAPHAARTLNLLPLPQIIGAFGLWFFIESIRKNNNKMIQRVLYLLIIFTILYSVLWFFHAYFVNLKQELGGHFNNGATVAMERASSMEDTYKKIIVVNNGRLFESYMFYLFQNKIDPSAYQDLGGTGSGGFAQEHFIGSYEFLNEGNIKLLDGNLYIINAGQLDQRNVRIVEQIRDHNGEAAIWMVEKK